MTTDAKPWRLLVGLKQRRLAREQQALRDKTSARDACQAGLRAAHDQLAQAEQEHAQARQRLMDKLSGNEPFSPALVPRLRDDLDRCEQKKRQAATEVQAKQAQLTAAEEALRLARQLVNRVDSQLAQARERLRDALAQLERESDDATDEDAEETAVARMLLARASAGDAGHAAP